MTIKDWRQEIDGIDAELVRLLNNRAALALKIGELKHGRGLEICDPQREREVIDRVCQGNPGPLSDSAIERIFRRIVREARAAEMNIVDPMDNRPPERIAG